MEKDWLRVRNRVKNYYRYWVVRCRKNPEHLIPVRQAVDAAVGDRPTWPDRFDATCPTCAGKVRYSAGRNHAIAKF